MTFKLLFDNGGGILLDAPNYCHYYDRPDWAAHDVAALITGVTHCAITMQFVPTNPANWDNNQPECRRDAHSSDDVMTSREAKAIYYGAEPRSRGAAWNEFCSVLKECL